MSIAAAIRRRIAVTSLPRLLLATPLRRFTSRRPPGPHADDDRAVLSAVADSTSTAIPDMLAAHGVDVERVCRRCPAALRHDVTRLQAFIGVLSKTHLDPAKIINRYPRVLHLQPDQLASTLAFLHTLLINAPKAVESCPQLLIFPSKTLQTKMKTLALLGLPTERIIKRSPAVFTRSGEAIRRQLALLRLLGLDAKLIVARFPPVIGLTETHIRTSFTYLNDVGLDGATLINAQPPIISMNIDRKLGPTIEFITKKMGRSLEEINRAPVCFSISLTRRLKPRYFYMMAHGRRKDYSLGTLCTPPDDRFAWLVAGQPVQHYRHWLELFSL